MSTYTSFDAVGAKEDVSDKISRLATTKTPMQTLIGTDKIKNKSHQWHEDDLASVKVNAKVEGADAVLEAVTPTEERSNVTQIFSTAYAISGSVDAIDFHARASEAARVTANRMAEVKRDLEHALVGTKQIAVTGNSATPRQMAGVQALIDSGNIVLTGAVGTAITENKLFDALQTLYTVSSDPSHVMVTPTDARVIASFASAAGRERDLGTGTKLVNYIELIQSPFGQVKVVQNQFLAAGDTLVFSPENWKLLVLRPWFRETLAKTGDSTKMQIIGEFSLRHDNFKASALVRRG